MQGVFVEKVKIFLASRCFAFSVQCLLLTYDAHLCIIYKGTELRKITAFCPTSFWVLSKLWIANWFSIFQPSFNFYNFFHCCHLYEYAKNSVAYTYSVLLNFSGEWIHCYFTSWGASILIVPQKLSSLYNYGSIVLYSWTVYTLHRSWIR